MADLDDFFAKKDRKKSKGKKFMTTDEIAKKLEESGRKNEKTKRDKTTMQSQALGTETDEQGNTIQEEDEWREFEEQKKDYSGLRIGKLQIQEGVDDGDADGEEEELEENEAGEMVVRTRKVQSGPWKMQQIEQQQQLQEQQQQAQLLAAQQAAAAEAAEAERRAEQPERSTYRPPAFRNPQREMPSFGGMRSRMKTAPDISNEESFPTLSASKNMDQSSGPWARRRRDEVPFEEVRNSKSHSSRYTDASRLTASSGPKLSLGNKFGALSHDQS